MQLYIPPTLSSTEKYRQCILVSQIIYCIQVHPAYVESLTGRLVSYYVYETSSLSIRSLHFEFRSCYTLQHPLSGKTVLDLDVIHAQYNDAKRDRASFLQFVARSNHTFLFLMQPHFSAQNNLCMPHAWVCVTQCDWPYVYACRRKISCHTTPPLACAERDMEKKPCLCR